ncbi:small ribosomal subunit protein eS27-like isoform X1 [Acipenser ruthenus]|uniref:small ribosomal subunit protein eS27-like isoform X1 n=1 Tax=Acipenser ruthenus TaxID=7906 RepID=UPI002740A24D|nr:small ribosomal subunit protein eS27-like isoform X1 [Acipenser ruthenus]
MTSLLWPCCGGGETPEDTRVSVYPRNRPFSNNRLDFVLSECELDRKRSKQKVNYLKKTTMPLAKDLMHPLAEVERQKHKKKRLVQSPNSYFMDVKCPGCYRITTVFSHAQRVVPCGGCSYVLCQPKGGKCRLTEGCSFRRKPH